MRSNRGGGRKRAVGPVIAIAVLGATIAAAPPAAAGPADDYVPGGCIDNEGIGAQPFVDVGAGAFYYDAVRWAYRNMIVAGFDATHFAPGANVSRGEFAAFLHRTACLPAPAGVADFDDLVPGAFYRTAVDWMVGEEITQGKTATTYGPDDPMTRGEFAAFLFRFIGEPGGAPIAPFGDIDRAAFFAAAIDWLLYRSVTQGTTPTTFSPWSHITRGEVVAFLHRLNTIADLALRLDPVATWPSSPTAAATDPTDGAVYLTERAGTVYRIPPGTDGRPNWLAAVEVLDISGLVGVTGEGGLLSVAVEPDGSALILSYTTSGSGDSVLQRYPLDASGVPTAPGSVVITVAQPQSNHNAGQVVFGPDGYLYTSFGDGGGGNDDDSGHTPGVGNGQDTTSNLLGDILRIDPSPSGGYTVPGTNPFVGVTGDDEIWASGVRNPWRFTFDSDTGDLWVADVGQGAREEITRLRAVDGGGRGANLGWRLREGAIATPVVGGPPPAGHVGPVHNYVSGPGCASVTGGYVYRGSDIPALWGTYVYGDFCLSDLLRGWRDLAGAEPETFSVGVPEGSLVSFLEDGTGELYTISINGTIARLVRATG